jgi:hypothetical protein
MMVVITQPHDWQHEQVAIVFQDDSDNQLDERIVLALQHATSMRATAVHWDSDSWDYNSSYGHRKAGFLALDGDPHALDFVIYRVTGGAVLPTMNPNTDR